jgi:hypothetical protein
MVHVCAESKYCYFATCELPHADRPPQLRLTACHVGVSSLVGVICPSRIRAAYKNRQPSLLSPSQLLVLSISLALRSLPGPRDRPLPHRCICAASASNREKASPQAPFDGLRPRVV